MLIDNIYEDTELSSGDYGMVVRYSDWEIRGEGQFDMLLCCVAGATRRFEARHPLHPETVDLGDHSTSIPRLASLDFHSRFLSLKCALPHISGSCWAARCVPVVELRMLVYL